MCGEREEREFFYNIFCIYNFKEGFVWDLFYIRF